MTDHIKREDVLFLVKHTGYDEAIDLGCCYDNDLFSDLVAKIPAADVAEVRHAKWLPTKNFSGLKCSACGARVKNGAWRTHKWCYAWRREDGRRCERCG